ncbi:MAG: YihY/virulence factor BrkB family protein [Ktedonobacteraceae bacterium]|nr:YihY/virulence factor BrkB family protein [Ktedonobacteraceae bacterium]MBO0792233.1 YihY/virulence factor BrkB family protein [Ktedonobacteraceae bacterium]
MEERSSKESSKHVTPAEIVGNIKEETKPLRAFFQKFMNDWSMNFAAALAYNLLTAMFPIAVALLAVVGLFLSNQADLHQFAERLVSILPSQVNNPRGTDLIASIFQQLAKLSGVLGIIAFLTAFFGGSRLFIAMENYFSIIYRLRPRPFLRQNMMAFCMLAIFIVLVPLMVFIASFPSVILAFLASNPTLKSIPFFSAVASNPVVTYLATFISGWLIGWIFFQVIYMVVPNQHISLRNSWLGAVIAALALQIYLALFSWYATHFMSSYAEQVGFALILLTFFYYFAVILLLGAEVNAFFSEHVRPLPDNIATVVSTVGSDSDRGLV